MNLPDMLPTLLHDDLAGGLYVDRDALQILPQHELLALYKAIEHLRDECARAIANQALGLGGP